MSDSISVSDWMTHTLLAGALLLAVSVLVLRRLRAPIRQERIARWTVQTLLLLAVLTALPSWILVPIPAWMQTPAPRPDEQLSYVIVQSPEIPVWDVDAQLPEVSPVPEPQPVTELTPTVEQDGEAEVASARTPWPLLPTIYLAIASLFFLRFLLGFVALFRIRRDVKPAPARVRELATKVPGFSSRIRLVVSERITSPICFGLLRPVIVIPSRMASWLSDEELLWILAHECDHIRRGDGWTNLWLGLARCLYFPIPWFWLLPRSSEFAQECLADEAATGVSGQAVDYAAFLVTLTDRSKRVRSADRMVRVANVLAMRGQKSNLFRRVTMLLEPKVTGDQPSRLWAFLAGGSLVATTVVLSGLGVVRADEPKTEKTITIQVITGDEVKELKEAIKKAEKAKQEAIEQLIRARKQLQEQQAKSGQAEIAIVNPKISVARVLADKVQAEKLLAEKLQAEKLQADKVQAEKLQGYRIIADDSTGEKRLFLRVKDQDQPGDGLRRVRINFLKDNEEEVQRLQKTVEELKKTIELLKDQPEARKSLEKTVKEYEKKIAEARAKGEIPDAPKAPKAPAAPQAPAAPLAPLPPGKPIEIRMIGNMDQIHEQMNKSMEQLLKQLAAVDNPEAKLALEKAIQAHKQAMENLKKQGKFLNMNQDNFRFQADPFQKLQGFQGFQAQSPNEPSPGRMGLTMSEVPQALVEQLDLPSDKGLLITQVRKGSPADKAGIRINDILLRMAGKDISVDPTQIAKQTAEIPGGKPFEVVVIRKGKKTTIENVVLPEVKKAVAVEGKKAVAVEGKKAVAVEGKKAVVVEGKKAEKGDVKEDAVTLTSNFNMISINNGTRYAIEGTMSEGKPEIKKIEIEVDGKTTKYDSLEKVPEEHRAGLKKLLSSVK